MAKYRDRNIRLDKSTVSPYKQGEPAKKRHARRLQQNKERLDIVLKWCDANGVSLEIKNDWHHWQFIVSGKTFDWWPSTAKLVIDQNYKRGIHVHDYTQVMKIIEKEL